MSAPRSRRRAILAGILAASAGARVARAQGWELAAGALGGGWDAMAAGLSAMIEQGVPGLALRIVPGGGLGNPTRIQNGVSEIGFATDVLASAAARGADPFRARHDRIAHAGTGYSPTEHHMLARRDGGPSELEAILTMPGLRIGAPPGLTADTLALTSILGLFGTSVDRIRESGGRVVQGHYNDLRAAFGDGQIDYIYAALARPAAMVDAIRRGPRQAILIPFPRAVMDHLTRRFGFGQGTIPSGTYPAPVQTGDLPVPTMDTALIVQRTLPEETVYRIVRAIIANRAQLPAIHPSMAAFDPTAACALADVPIHPGARRAFAESGCTA